MRKRLISDEEAGNFQSWHAPEVEGSVGSNGFTNGRPPTAKEIQALQKQAHEEARQQGHEQGYQQGLKKAADEFQQRLNLFDGYLSLFKDPLKKLNHEIEENMVKLSLLIARHIIRRELKQEPGEIVAVVREAIKVIPASAERTRIFLHPEDAELVCAAFSLKDEEVSWRIEEDILLMRGDCRIETESSTIDASVESRLSAIAAQMLGGERTTDE